MTRKKITPQDGPLLSGKGEEFAELTECVMLTIKWGALLAVALGLSGVVFG